MTTAGCYILFLCPHGGAKSVIAASYFNDMAARYGIELRALAAATEDPYEAVPEPVAKSLLAEGFDVRDFRPRSATADDIATAVRVITIEQWDDVPMVSVDLPGASQAIRRHVETLVHELKGDR